MKTAPFKKKLLLSQLLLALSVTSVYANEEPPTLPATSTGGETITEAPLPDFFHIPIWGLRVNGSLSTRPLANDTWKYYAVGRAILKVSPSYIDYGTQVIGEPLREDIIKLQNVGADSLTIGDTAAPHQYITNRECDGAVLPPMATCIFTVRYTPVDVRTAEGMVDIPFSAKGGEAVAAVLVQGKSVKPPTGGGSTEFPEMQPNANGEYELRFPPPIYLGDDPKYRKFELVSSGQKDLSIKSIAVTEGTLFYAPTHNCPQVLKVGEKCDITVQLNPLAVGEVTGRLRVASNSMDDSDVRVRLIADIEEWVRKLDNPSEVDFGIVDQGYATTRTVELTASGNLPVSNIKITPPSPFTVSKNTCTATLQPTQKCEVTFSLNSNVRGPVSGTAMITADELSIPATNILLKADVQLRQGTFSPTSFAFGLKDMAKLAPPRSITFTNTGSIPVVPYFGPLSTPGEKSAARGTSFKRWFNDWTYLDPAGCVNEVAPGASCTALITVQPTLTTSQSGSVTAYPHEGMTVRGTNLSVSAQGTKQSFVYTPTLIDLGILDGVHTVEASIEITNTSLDDTSLTGFGTALTQPSASRGTITLNGGTCGSTLTMAAKSCVIKALITGTSLAKDEVQESKDGIVRFRYTGADTEYTSVPVHFNLRGNDPTVTIDDSDGGLDFGDVPVGVAAADAPRRFIKIKNPGPSTMLISNVSYPGAKAYSLTTAVDHEWEGSCGFNKPIPAGSECVIALYPTSAPNSTWGEVSTNVQLVTVINGVTSTFGPQFEMKANHLPVTIEMVDNIHFDGGEQVRQTWNVPFRVSHGGSAWLLASASSATNMSSQVNTPCVKNGVFGDVECSVVVTSNAARGLVDRSLDANVYINYEGRTVLLDTAKVTFTPEQTTYSLTESTWDLGDVTAQGLVAESGALRKNHILKNTSTQSNLVVQTMVANSNMYRQHHYGSGVAVEGVSTYCQNVTLVPGASCYWTLDMTTAMGHLEAQGDYSHTAVMQVNNELAQVPLPITANFLTGELEIVEQPDAFVDIPSATVSEPKALVLRNVGQGNLRFTTNPGLNGTYSVVSDGTTVDFQLVNHQNNRSTNYNPQTSTHKPAGTDASQNCTQWYGLQPGAECTVYVVMTPTGLSRQNNGEIRLELRKPAAESVVVPLTGNSRAANVYYSSEFFEFPDNMLVGTTYKSQIVVGNGGNYPLNISQLKLNADDDAAKSRYPETELSIEHDCPTVLPAGDECVIEMTLTPDRNLDWGVAPKQRVHIVESSRGVNNTKYLYMVGKSSESFLTATPYEFQLDGVMEVANFESQFIYKVEFESTGQAPVRITGKLPDTGFFVVRNSTCAVDLTLQPGQKCSLEIWSKEDLTTVLRPVENGQWTFSPLTINGTQVKDTGETIVDRSTRLIYKARVVASSADFSFTPTVVPANRSLPVHVFHPSISPGITLNMDGRVTQPSNVQILDAYKVVSAPQPGFETAYVANGNVRDVEIQLKNKGITPWVKRVMKAEDFNLFYAGEGANVFSLTTGLAATRFGLSRAAAGLDGVVSFNTAADTNGNARGGFSFHGRTGALESDIGGALAGLGLHVAGAELEDGSKIVMVANYVHGNSGCSGGWSGSCWGDSSYTNYGLYKVTSNGGSLVSTALDSGSGRNTGSDRTRLRIASVSDDKNYIEYSTRSSSAYVQGATTGLGKFNHNLRTLPSGSKLNGVAAYEGYAYIWMDDTIYSYELGSSTPYPVAYRFPGVLNEAAASGMAYSKKSNSLLLPCHEGTAICSIPVYRGAMGVANVEGGQVGVRGYNDGNGNATLDVKKILNVSADGNYVFFESASGSNSVRALSIGTIPAFGSIGVLNNEFQASLNPNGDMVPHEIRLKNLGSNPLNIIELSNADIEYSTTCVNIEYLGECTVTVQMPKSQLDVGFGSFQIDTTALVKVPVTWTLAGDIVTTGTYRTWRDGSLAQSCNGYRQGENGKTYSGAIGSGVYRIQPTGLSATNVYCDMVTDGGGWTLVARSVGTQFPANIFSAAVNASTIHTPNAVGASALNVPQWSTAMNTQQAMLVAPYFSASPIIDRNTGNWTYTTPRCGAVLGHTGTSAGCTTEGANDEFSGVDRFNLAIDNGTKAIAPNHRADVCYPGGGFCDFGFYLK